MIERLLVAPRNPRQQGFSVVFEAEKATFNLRRNNETDPTQCMNTAVPVSYEKLQKGVKALQSGELWLNKDNEFEISLRPEGHNNYRLNISSPGTFCTSFYGLSIHIAPNALNLMAQYARSASKPSNN